MSFEGYIIFSTFADVVCLHSGGLTVGKGGMRLRIFWPLGLWLFPPDQATRHRSVSCTLGFLHKEPLSSDSHIATGLMNSFMLNRDWPVATSLEPFPGGLGF